MFLACDALCPHISSLTSYAVEQTSACNSSVSCLFPPPPPSSFSPFAPPQSTAGPPSLRPVSMLFHLACCYRGLDAGRLQLGSQSFSIYQSPPPPPSLQPPTLTTLTRATQQCLITSQPSMPPYPPPPPALSHPPLLISVENLALTPQDKKRYCGGGSI